MKLQLSGHKLLWHTEILEKWQKGEFFYPLHLDIGPSYSCSQDCAFCYVGYLRKKGGRRQKFLEKEVFLRLMEELGEAGVKSIAMCGCGEPLLNSATPNAVVRAKECGVDVSLITNGVHFTPTVAEKTLESLSWVRFSIYGASKKVYDAVHRGGENDWENAYSNLREICEIKRKRSLKTTIGSVMLVLPENGHEVDLLAQRLKEYGVDYLSVKPATQNPKNTFSAPRDLHKRFKDNLLLTEKLSSNNFHVEVRWDQFGFEEQFIESGRSVKGYGECLGLPFIACIDADGSVYACNGHWRNPKFLYGNVYEKPYKEIWQDAWKRMYNLKDEINLGECEPICRTHAINNFLWQLNHPPEHINFP